MAGAGDGLPATVSNKASAMPPETNLFIDDLPQVPLDATGSQKFTDYRGPSPLATRREGRQDAGETLSSTLAVTSGGVINSITH